MKLLSIVIANYNYGRFLEGAIQSVITQDGFEECELIICDAASKDESVEIIRKYADKLAWWCSEKDGGQSEAFNKGFSHATGKYLTWLNADDILVPGCLRKILSEMKKHPDCEWFTGNFYRFIEDSSLVSEICWGPHWYPGFLQFRNSPLVTFGPSTFFSKVLYERAGRIDERLHFIMDIDLWCTFMEMGVRKRRINCFCWAFRLHEVSKTAEYGEHKRTIEVQKKGAVERKLVDDKHTYRMSRMLWLLVNVIRLLDGSFFKRMCFRRKYMGKCYKLIEA